jgi:hypothetical protein
MKQKNKTAVEWFFRELENVNGYSAFYTNNYQHIDALYNEAKQMEKKQITKAYDCTNSMAMYGEDYYNETYEAKEDR